MVDGKRNRPACPCDIVSRRVVLHFPRRLTGEPVISNLVRRYGLDFNILRASITPWDEGLLVLDISGGAAACQEGIDYLAGLGVRVQPIEEDVMRDASRCTHCGACTSICPTAALALDRATMEVVFDSGKCVACRACVGACPVKAMRITL